MNFRHDVLAVHENARTFGRPQRDVQHGAIFGDVDLLAAEHRLDPRLQSGFLRQLQQQLERFVGDAVLRVIQEQSGGLEGHSLPALGIGGEQFLEVQAFDFPVMRRERFPGRALGERFED